MLCQLNQFMGGNYSFTREDKNKYYYKILFSTLVLHILGLIGYLYFKNINNDRLVIYISLGVLLGWFLVFALPVYVLYFNHKKFSKAVSFEVNGSVLKYNNKLRNEIINFTFDDIEKVELWLTPPAYDERTDWLFFGKYHFTRIYTRKKQIINISCLVFEDTKEVFSEELIIRKKKFFPIMKKNKI